MTVQNTHLAFFDTGFFVAAPSSSTPRFSPTPASSVSVGADFPAFFEAGFALDTGLSACGFSPLFSCSGFFEVGFSAFFDTGFSGFFETGFLNAGLSAFDAGFSAFFDAGFPAGFDPSSVFIGSWPYDPRSIEYIIRSRSEKGLTQFFRLRVLLVFSSSSGVLVSFNLPSCAKWRLQYDTTRRMCSLSSSVYLLGS